MAQELFSGVETFFRWTTEADGSTWYQFDEDAARKHALRERNRRARELERAGYTVRKFSLGKQLRSKGGIGSGKPHIEFLSTCYGLNYSHGSR